MDVDDAGRRRCAERMGAQHGFQRRERVRKGPFHEHLPKCLCHQNLAPAGGLKKARAAARRRLGIVQGPQDARLLLDKLQHVALIEGMIAKRQAIGPGLQQQFRVRRGQPVPGGGILAVHHDEIQPPVLAQLRQCLTNGGAARAAHHVAKKKKSHIPGLGGLDGSGKGRITRDSVTTPSSNWSVSSTTSPVSSCAS